MPHLSPNDLRQMDKEWQEAQSEAVVRSVLERTLEQLRIWQTRLDQNPQNSSRPSGSMPPWAGKNKPAEETPDEAASQARTAVADAVQALLNPTTPAAPVAPAPPTAPNALSPAKQSRAGRITGAPGYGRSQKLAVTHTEQKRPTQCAACHSPLPGDGAVTAWSGWDTLELLGLPDSSAAPTQTLGLHIQVTRHLLMQQSCSCGHDTQAQASHADKSDAWPGVELSERRLLGPRLSAVVVYLHLRMRLPLYKVQELLKQLFGLEISTALINQTVHQTARSAAPLEAELTEDLRQAALVYADETSWPQAGTPLWLWVLACSHSVLYVIGERSKEMFFNAIGQAFVGKLMTDGYTVYRPFTNRLRCWAHLHRKLRGVAECSDRTAARIGTQMQQVFEGLMRAVFEARKSLEAWEDAGRNAPKPEPPSIAQANAVVQLQKLCQQQRDAAYPALRAVAREFLNDWDVIMAVMAEPRMPLTNNAAERQLRHWVIARRISYGTRTTVGSNSLAVLASVIDTCRLRGGHVLELLSSAIHTARHGLPSPKLPPIPPHLLAGI